MDANASEPPDRAVARKHALEIAGLLKSKAVSYRKQTRGEPRCLYRIPFHSEHFWFKILVSDTAYVFIGEHRRNNSFTASFCAAIKHGWKNLLATKHLPILSAKMSMAVYSTNTFSEEIVSQNLLEPKAQKLISKIDSIPIRLFFINPVQIYFVSELISPKRCVQQVQILRELLLTIHNNSCKSFG